MDIAHGLCQCGCGASTSLAKKTRAAYGQVQGQPVPYLKGHRRRGEQRLKAPLYIEENRGYTTPCWIWQHGKNGNGYGVRRSRQHESTLVHRQMFEDRFGPCSASDLDHLCRVPACVNPEHLEAVTHTLNMRRASNTRLTANEAAKIRKAQGTQAEIAAQFGISQSSVSRIRRGESWKLGLGA